MNKAEAKAAAIRVSFVSIVSNVVLSVFKLFAGITGSSAAMISDAVHSVSDVLSTFIVIAGINIANRSDDKDHRYGHERFECIASIILAGTLLATGIGIGYEGIKNIISEDRGKLVVPESIALIAAVVSILTKEAMYHYTKHTAIKINSGSLMADAWHHRSDALSSVGSLIGIGGAMLGFPVLDSVFAVVISAFIVKAAYDIFKDATDKLVDTSCDEETVGRMREVAAAQSGVIEIDEIKTRLFGSKIYVDIEIGADKSLTLEEAHRIAESVHESIENNFENVKHCMVHVNPK